jgi:hypothetical protein
MNVKHVAQSLNEAVFLVVWLCQGSTVQLGMVPLYSVTCGIMQDTLDKKKISLYLHIANLK